MCLTRRRRKYSLTNKYPCVLFHSEIQQMISSVKKVHKNHEECQICVTHHQADSHRVNLRHAAVNSHTSIVKKKMAEEISSFFDWFERLPPKWTLIQTTEFRLYGKNPISKVKGSSFPTELKSILEESRLVNKESRNNRDPRYCRLKQKHHCKLEVRSKNSTSKSPIVTELIAHLITTQSILEHLKVAKRNPVFLVLDKIIQQLLWESLAILNPTTTSRIPSLLRSSTIKHGLDQGRSTKQQSKAPSPSTDLKLSAKQVDPTLTYCIVNDQDLPGVQQRLQPILEEFWGKHHDISGAVEQQVKQCLKERYLILYCGHGSGSKYIPNDQLIKVDCRAAPILISCSSGQLSANGRVVDPTGAAAVFLMAGSPGLIGMLWEVTDIDCDRFTVRLLDFLLGARKSSCNKSSTKSEMRSLQNGGGKSGKGSDLPSPPAKRVPEILRAVALSRPITKNFLTGAAAVVYGLPLRALNFNEVL